MSLGKIGVAATSSKGVRAARKKIEDSIPGTKSQPSEVRLPDGRLKPDSEDSLNFGLLLGDRNTNDRSEDDDRLAGR
jgi:hypothetical protein